LATSIARRLSLLVGAVAIVAFGTALPASAHPTLLTTTPEAGYSVESVPDRVTLVFDEPVSVGPHGVRVENADHEPIRSSEVSREQAGRRLVVKLLQDLPPGRYVVRWQVTAQDGDVVDAGFDFAVATAADELRGREAAASEAFPLVAVLRWLLFLGLVGVLGGLAGELVARRTIPDAYQPRSLIVPASVVGSLAAAGLLSQVAIGTGGLGRGAYLLGVEVLAFALAGAFARRFRRWGVALPASAVIAAESLRNHLGSQRGLVGALVIAVHLVSISIWLGALLHLLRLAHRNRGGVVRVGPAFVAYSRLALVLFGLAAVTGSVAGMLLVPSLSALTSTAYGRVLIVKLGLVVVIVILAWIARRHLSRTRASAPRAALAEAATMAVVLAVTAGLVSLATPSPVTRDIGYPVPVAGPVIRLGTLAGQIAVGIAASENQLEVRLRVPDDGVQLGDSPVPEYRLAALVGATGSVVDLRPCGPGCFVGPVPWRAGTTYVELDVAATGWHGGVAVLPIHWAPQIAPPDVLSRVRAAMLTQRSIRITEAVTSDTSVAAPKPRSVIVDGDEFLASDPYASPPDPEVVRRARPGGGGILTFGLSAEGIQVELEVDASYRIVAETLAAPKHLVRRTFTYPG